MVEYDNKSQLKKLEPYVLQGETLQYVYDIKGLGGGFVGFTNQRLIFMDKSRLSKKKVLQTIPYSKVKNLSVDVGGIGKGVFSSSTIEINDKYSFEFRGADKASNAYRLIAQKMITK